MSSVAAGPEPALFEIELPAAPYPGLRPFERHEWPIFFGREPMIHDVIACLDHQNLVVVHGDSGCGKSSLIRAGVLVQLEQQHERGGQRWRTCLMLPREAPLRHLAQELAKLDAAAVDRDRIRQIRRCLNLGRNAPAALADLLRCGEDDHVCILIDQFEELFSFARKHGRDEAQLFVDVLVGLQADPPPGLYVIVTMRSEFLGVCARFSGLAEAVNNTQYLLPQMERPALLRAIREPATLYDGEVSRELAEHLISDAGGMQDQLPLIQHGLMRLSQKVGSPPAYRFGLAEAGAAFHQNNVLADVTVPFRHETGSDEPAARLVHQGDDAVPSPFDHDRRGRLWRLGLEDYRSAGGFADLLSAHADEVMVQAATTPGRKRIVEHLFRALTEINAEGSAVRRPQTFAELRAATGSDEETLRDILDHFRAEGVSFLSPYGDAPIGPDTLIDISHEALIRHWRKISDRVGGWLQREFEDGLIWKTLRLQAQKGETLSAAATDDRDTWLKTVPSREWCERYGGGWTDVQQLMNASRNARKEEERRQRELHEAKRREAEARAQSAEDARQAAEAARQAAAALAAKEQELRAAQTRRAQLAIAVAFFGLILAALATGGFIYALQQETRAKASSYWTRLSPWGDPIDRRDLAAFWDLTQEDRTVRVAFVRQLADNPDLLDDFGRRPQPIARAVGLSWPDEARDIGKQSVAYIASDRFDPDTAKPFQLVSYARVVAALEQWLDSTTRAAAAQKVATWINDLAAAPRLNDQQLRALAEMVGVFRERFGSEAIETALEKLHSIVGTAEQSGSAGWRDQTISRAIEVMAPQLSTEERSRAVRYLAPLLGQNMDSWGAKAVPRALTALLPEFRADPLQPPFGEVPGAIAKAAVERSSGDSSYLLTLILVAEEIASTGGQATVAAFGQAFVQQFATANQPVQRAALARATIPLLPQLPSGPTVINLQIADITSLLPDVAALDPEQRLDPVQRSRLHQSTAKDIADGLSEAVSSPNPDQRKLQSEAVLQILRTRWSAELAPDVTPDPYQRAAQGRLLAELAPSLTPDSAALASADLLRMLPQADDFLAREAIARALAALATSLPETQREEVLKAAKSRLAWTGSTEEATAWAHAIATLLPTEPRAATAAVVEALKHPTATGAPTNILLAALAKPWPEEHSVIAGRTLPDQAVFDWLEDHLPVGHSLTEPPPRPSIFQPEGAGPGSS